MAEAGHPLDKHGDGWVDSHMKPMEGEAQSGCLVCGEPSSTHEEFKQHPYYHSFEAQQAQSGEQGRRWQLEHDVDDHHFDNFVSQAGEQFCIADHDEMEGLLQVLREYESALETATAALREIERDGRGVSHLSAEDMRRIARAALDRLAQSSEGESE